jgi:hypothetical protein
MAEWDPGKGYSHSNVVMRSTRLCTIYIDGHLEQLLLAVWQET